MLNLFALALATTAPAAMTPNTTMQFDRWERRLRHRIGELHAFPEGADKDWAGDVAVRFSIGADGRPRNASIQQSSGNPIFDRAARRVVRLLGPIGQVPSIDGKSRAVVLVLSYGEGDTGDRRTATAAASRIGGLHL